MQPYSRGRPPHEYTLRIACEFLAFTSLSKLSDVIEISISGIKCRCSSESGNLIILASGFTTAQGAKEAFREIQTKLSYSALVHKFPFSVPNEIQVAAKSDYWLMAESIRSAEHGWPSVPINPLHISTYGAFVYPEHDFVTIDGFFKVHPKFTFNLNDIVAKFEEKCDVQLDRAAIDDDVSLAIAAYVQAARSMNWVSNFLSLVSMLEMLATVKPANHETNVAIKAIAANIRRDYKSNSLIDISRIVSCLNQAKSESITSAVKYLVKHHCAPGVAATPLGTIFSDESDCNKKITAVYNLRSKYTHNGRIANPKGLSYSFDTLYNVTFQSLGHILKNLLEGHSTNTEAKT